MSDMGDDFREMRRQRKEHRDRYAIACEGCITHCPERTPSKLFPGDKCGWCGYVRPKEPKA